MAGSFNEQILQGLRPNFFELLSQEAMGDALRPAFKYITKILAQSRPDLLEVMWRYSDEIFLVFEGLLQLYFIRTHAGSLSEVFYSLKRVCHSQSTKPLTRRDKMASLLCLAVVPYYKVKLDAIFHALQEIDDATPLTWQRGCGLKQLAAVAYIRVYPYLQSLWEASKFLFRLLYLFKKTEYYSPLLYISGLKLSRIIEEEGPSSGGGYFQWFVGNLLPFGVFSLKFLEWWYSAERSAVVKTMTSLPVPPPPKRIKPNPSGVKLPSDPSLCPLCGQLRVQATTLSSSGYVFCYLCIHDYVQKHGECPVTCLPTSKQQLVRLYLQQQLE